MHRGYRVCVTAPVVRFDSMYPKEDMKYLKEIGFTRKSATRQVWKKFQKKKQRQYDKVISREDY